MTQGAERQVKVPGELSRFAELPMEVEYHAPEGEGGASTVQILQFVGVAEAEGVSQWRLANVRANRTGGKGKPLNKKQRETVIEIKIDAIKRVNLHIDI